MAASTSTTAGETITPLFASPTVTGDRSHLRPSSHPAFSAACPVWGASTSGGGWPGADGPSPGILTRYLGHSLAQVTTVQPLHEIQWRVVVHQPILRQLRVGGETNLEQLVGDSIRPTHPIRFGRRPQCLRTPPVSAALSVRAHSLTYGMAGCATPAGTSHPVLPGTSVKKPRRDRGMREYLDQDPGASLSRRLLGSFRRRPSKSPSRTLIGVGPNWSRRGLRSAPPPPSPARRWPMNVLSRSLSSRNRSVAAGRPAGGGAVKSAAGIARNAGCRLPAASICQGRTPSCEPARD